MQYYEYQSPFHKRILRALYFFGQSEFEVTDIIVAQQVTTDEKETRHVEHIQEP